MRDGSMPAATKASSNVIRCSADIEFASLLVPNTASPQFCESNHWQCLMNRCGSGKRSALNGVRTGASTPRRRSGGEAVVCGIAERKPRTLIEGNREFQANGANTFESIHQSVVERFKKGEHNWPPSFLQAL